MSSEIEKYISSEKRPPVRLSLSIPADVADGLEALVAERGYPNRSAAVADVVRNVLVEERRRLPDAVMAGTVTLFYDENCGTLQSDIARVQRKYLTEVVSNLSVMLEADKRMEVLIVQGPVQILDKLVYDLTALRGVESGRLQLASALLPPLHERS